MGGRGDGVMGGMVMPNKGLLEDGGNIIYLEYLKKNAVKRIAKEYCGSKLEASQFIRANKRVGNRIICKDGEI